MLKYWSGREQLVMIPEGGCSAQCAAGCSAVLHVLQSRARVKLCINVLPSLPPRTPPRSPGQDGHPGARGAARRDRLLHARLHPADGRHAGAGGPGRVQHREVLDPSERAGVRTLPLRARGAAGHGGRLERRREQGGRLGRTRQQQKWIWRRLRKHE